MCLPVTARGRNGGRRKKLSPAQEELLFQLYDSKQHTVSHICKLLGLSKSALYGRMQRRKM